MVLESKITLQGVPKQNAKYITKLQQYTSRRKNRILRFAYGSLLILISMLLIITNPLEKITNWYLEVEEGSFVFKMWQRPTYQLFSEVFIFNYTNVPQYLSGEEKIFKLEEVGPFKFQEIRTNEEMSIDKKTGNLKMVPNTILKFLPAESIGEMQDVKIYVPNIALIAISTLIADKFSAITNNFMSTSIRAFGSKLFRNLTAEEFLMGYYDPIVTHANTFLPGWIDFGKIGIMDRFYAQKEVNVKMELKDPSRRYTINSWDDSEGLVEQGFKDWNTSSLCNRIKGSYEGLMITPKFSKDRIIPIFRKQACRVYPFTFHEDIKGHYGFNYYRYTLERSAFNNTSPYACACKSNCLPNGFVDVSTCFYNFPIALSKPHFLDVDPTHLAYYRGMRPNQEKHTSWLDFEPTTGVPLSLSSNIQVNIAARTSWGSITAPLKDKVLPLLWLSMYCDEPPPEVMNLLRLRFVIAPPLLITIEVLLFIIGLLIGIKSFYTFFRSKYAVVNTNDNDIGIYNNINKAIVDDEGSLLAYLDEREIDCEVANINENVLLEINR